MPAGSLMTRDTENRTHIINVRLAVSSVANNQTIYGEPVGSVQLGSFQPDIVISIFCFIENTGISMIWDDSPTQSTLQYTGQPLSFLDSL